jgi:cbb3-type cytochrome oxidase subunit 3
MFNQIRDLAGGEFYLISSLLLFMVFFIVVTVYLLKLSKHHVAMMSNLPIEDQQVQDHEED